MGVNLKSVVNIYKEYKMKKSVNHPEVQNRLNEHYFIFNLKGKIKMFNTGRKTF